MNEKTKTVRTLYRIGYTHVTEKGQIRPGSIALEAANVEEAQKIAAARLDTFGLRHHRIVSAKEY